MYVCSERDTDLPVGQRADDLHLFAKCEISPDVAQMSRNARKPVFGISTRSDTNRLIHLQKNARILKFWV